MPFYTRLGLIPQKRHVQFRRPDGCLYSEEVFGTEGFVGPTTTMYHIHPPTQVYGWKPLYSTKVEYVEQDIMRMRHVKSAPLAPKGDFVTGRVVLFGNSDCEMAVCNPAEQMAYHYKNGQGDECLFIHYGSGVCHTMLGTLKFGPRDYLVIPKGVIYTIVWDARKTGADGKPADGGPPVESMPFGKVLLIETTNGSHIGPPPRYVSKAHGQFLEHAPFCERDIRTPETPMTWDEKGEFEVRIKARDLVHSYTYHYHPLDIVGWDGCYYPFIFNADDFSPITGKLHMPPPIHQTFEAHNFVICTFAPRMLDYHPQSIKVPYNHSNLDSDEVLYYVDGNFGSRKGIEIGSLTLHPQGIPHGPHPGTIEASLAATHTQELAVMCDTFRPLFPTKAALEMDDTKYPASWQGEHFPGLSSRSMHLNGVTVPAVHAAAFPREVAPVAVIKAEVGTTVIPAPVGDGGKGAGTPAVPMRTANVWAP
ncbi:MAG: homogentisate 1,2-dioxygenase domain-containing protein [Planctomycetota bacterium]|nr:homogentisate 1,2-dioxygenase domain-containing protein [Planctomycetota bacterium]